MSSAPKRPVRQARPRLHPLAPLALAASLAAWAALPSAHAQALPATTVNPAPAGADARGALASVAVQRYALEGNTLIPAERLLPLLQPYTGVVALAQLRAAAATVQDAYRDAGYGGVVAFLPEQELVGGTVRIRVVEGRLSRISVQGAVQFSPDNIRASLPTLATGRTPLVRRIDAEIQMANENPAKNVQVLLQPGTGAGDIVAQVTVTERPVLRATARLDNTGGKTIGRWRAALGFQHANVLDADHILAMELQTAPEDTAAVRVFSGSYRAPLYGRAMALDGYFAWSDIDAGKVGTAAGDLQFSGKGGIAGARASWYLPRWGNVDQRLVAGLEAREYRNSCTIAGLPQAACGAAGASVSLQPMSLTYTSQAQGTWRWGLSLGLHANAGLGGSNGSQADFEAVRSGAKKRYALARWSAQASGPLAEWGGVALRYSGQASGGPLVPGEMFGAGGANSVRGFEERELAGDSGNVLSLEASGPNLLKGVKALAGADLRPIVFVDTGQVGNADDAQCRAGRTRCAISGYGLGLRGAWNDWQLRLDAAAAGSDGATTAKGDLRAHVALLYNF